MRNGTAATRPSLNCHLNAFNLSRSNKYHPSTTPSVYKVSGLETLNFESIDYYEKITTKKTYIFYLITVHKNTAKPVSTTQPIYRVIKQSN